jgi:DNA-binding NarL/FixJ family response regulator
MARAAVVSMEKWDRIKVLAVESSRMNSQLLAEALALDSGLEVLGIEPKPASILAAVDRHRPHVILISTVLENSDTQGFDLARQISATCPAARVILLMDTSHPAAVVEAFRCGAYGIFSRTESSKSLAKCIHSVHGGQVWANSAELLYVLEALRASEPMPMRPMRPVESSGGASLSKREKDVVCCVAEGLSNREIAGRLGLTEHTVKNYLFRIFDKLGVSSRVEVALYVFRFCQDWIVAAPSNRGAAPTSGPRLLTAPAKSAGVIRPAVPPAAAV